MRKIIDMQMEFWRNDITRVDIDLQLIGSLSLNCNQDDDNVHAMVQKLYFLDKIEPVS